MPKTPHILFHHEAAEEAKEAAAFYKERNPAVAFAFKLDLAHTLLEVAEEPERSPRFEDSPTLRQHTFRHFPFSLFYAVKPNKILVVAVAHDRRRPGYWKRRV